MCKHKGNCEHVGYNISSNYIQHTDLLIGAQSRFFSAPNIELTLDIHASHIYKVLFLFTCSHSGAFIQNHKLAAEVFDSIETYTKCR